MSEEERESEESARLKQLQLLFPQNFFLINLNSFGSFGSTLFRRKPIGRLTFGWLQNEKRLVGRVGQMNGAMALPDKYTVGQMATGQKVFGEMSVGKMVFDEMFFDERTRNLLFKPFVWLIGHFWTNSQRLGIGISFSFQHFRHSFGILSAFSFTIKFL